MKMNKIYQGDCIKIMKKMDEDSVDAIITDPPYGLEFMGKEWDKLKRINTGGGIKGNMTGTGIKRNTVNYQAGTEAQHFHNQWATECLRVLKHGGFLLSFGGTRTYHRMVCGIEDAGFEIRDTIMWLYGSGFPKSLNIGKQIDKIEGNKREVIGEESIGTYKSLSKIRVEQGYRKNLTTSSNKINITKGSSKWEGWGTALKPACEPIVVARKPLSEKNVALNVLKWGTGGINIDAGRIGTDNIKISIIQGENINKITRPDGNDNLTSKGMGAYGVGAIQKTIGQRIQQGRFPANIILDETIKLPEGNQRFFYCAKSSKSERNFGCEGLEEKHSPHGSYVGRDLSNPKVHLGGLQGGVARNNHPTVKPLALMEYLIKLVTPPQALVLDPFLGSGTTAIACQKLNRRWIGIEKEEDYIKIAKARLKPFMEQKKLMEM